MSDEIAAANEGTTPVREGFAFDEGALAGWMQANVPGFAGLTRIEQFKGGQSNPTYKLVTPGGNYVLRRKPPGELLKGAHAVDREARVMSALHAAGFPAPRVHGLCTDDSVIGSWFFVMDMVEGRIFWDAAMPGMTPDERAAIYDAMNATIARLHSLDPEAIGLGDYGRRSNFFARQLATCWPTKANKPVLPSPKNDAQKTVVALLAQAFSIVPQSNGDTPRRASR